MNKFYNGIQSALRGAKEACVYTVCIADRRFNHIKSEDFPTLEYRNTGALQYAFGVALAGERALCVTRSLDTDELASVAHCGVNAALVVVVVDDDNRPYFDMHALLESCHLPCMEPATVYECKTYIKMACNLSEKYDVPVFVHIGQSLLDTTTDVEIVDPKTLYTKAYKRNREKYVTLPTTNRLCAEDMELRDKRIAADCAAFPIHTTDYRDKTMGVVCYGTTYASLQNAAPHVSVLRLGLSYPVPLSLVRDFAANIEDVIVLEEGEPLIERTLHCNGITCHGKDIFPLRMHYTPADVKERLLGVEVPHEDSSLPIRTPAFCTDCGLIDIYTALKKADVVVHADTGCAMLGAEIPMISVDTALAPSPIALGNGFAKIKPCYSVVAASAISVEDLRLLQCGHTVIVYGDVARLACDMDNLGLPYTRTTPKQFELTDANVILVDMEACQA